MPKHRNVNRNANSDPHPTPEPLPTPAPVAWVGLDWGHKTHAFALQARGGPVEEGTLPHSAESLHHWLRSLAQRWGGQPVAVAVEAKRGAVVDALLQYPWLILYPINPVTSARYRQAFTPSGASDDLPDAHVLLELVRDHPAKLRALEPQDPATTQLAGLVEVRRDLVDRRTQVLNQLTSLLRAFYPQALELVGKLNTDLAVAFLRRWPDLLSLKATSPGVLKRFYHAHNLRRPERLETRLQCLRQAVAVTTDPARLSVAVLHLQALLDQLQALRRHVRVLDQAIQRAFAEHPEADLFRELPGAGPALAPRLCVAFGTLRPLFPDPASLQKLAGLAPVREKSGQKVWTHWRWQAPVFLRQSFVEWAGQSVLYSPWAKCYYERMQAKGKGRGAILRALAFKWVRVLWRCWQTRTPYNELRYLQQLLHRKSPNAVPA